jgi:hypothetical protein
MDQKRIRSYPRNRDVADSDEEFRFQPETR